MRIESRARRFRRRQWARGFSREERKMPPLVASPRLMGPWRRAISVNRRSFSGDPWSLIPRAAIANTM